MTNFTEETRSNIEQEALATLSMYALERNKLSDIMHRAIQQCCIILDLSCAVITTLKDDNLLNLAADSGCAGDCVEFKNEEQWDAGFTLKSDKPVRVSDHGTEQRFKISPVMGGQGYTSSAHVAIRGAEKDYGVFSLYTEKAREFSDSDINFLQVLAHIIGMAIERQKTKQKLEEKNKDLEKEMERSREYQKEILRNSIAERWELGGYLHDNLAQMLVSAKLLFNNMEQKLVECELKFDDEISSLTHILDEAIQDIRNITHEIIPLDIEEEGVAQAFRLLAINTKKLHDVHCKFTADSIVNKIKDKEVATNLYHIAQEAVRNAVHHGHSKNISIDLRNADNQLMLRVLDDGKGIVKTSTESDGKGMRIMQHRIELMGGTMEIKDRAGQSGTLLKCTLPLCELAASKG